MAEDAVLQQSISNLGRTLSAQLQGINNTTMTFREAAVQQNRSVSNVVRDLFTAISSQRREQADTNEYLGQAIRDVEQSTNDNARANDATRDELDRVLSAEYKSLSELSEIKSYLKDIDDNTHGSVLSNLFDSVFTGSNFTSALSTAFGLAVSGLGGYMLGGGGGGGGGAGPLGPVDVGNGTGSGYEQSGLSKPQIAEMIRKSAKERGIDPEVAVRVSQSEGLNVYRSTAPGGKWGMAKEPSYGPFQLLVGQGTGGPTGLGDRFIKETGINPATDRSPASIQKQIDFALDEAKRKGWGQWYGAARAGIGSRQGLNQSNTSVNNNASTTTPVTPTQGKATTVTPPVTAPDAGRQALPSGMPSPTRGNTQAVGATLPQNDIVALGHTLQSQGFRISEHPAFGGVKGATPDKPWGVHSPTGGHGDGTAIDINIGEGNIEANDPAMGAKFDKLAEQLRSSGYQVIWRAPNHYDHLHARMLKGGQTPTGPATPTTPYASAGSTGAVTEQAAPTVDPRLYSSNPADIIAAGRDMMAPQLQAQGISIPGMGMAGMAGALMGSSPITSFGGAGMTNILNNLFGEDSSSLFQNQTSNILQQLQPQLAATQEIKNAAIQEKVATALQARTPEPERRETEPSQFAQSHERHFPQGSFSEYNTDNHLYPEWGSLITGIYGSLTSGIKTSLA